MGKSIAFLIDADNLNEPAAIREAFEKLHALAGVSTVRRAYGSADTLKGLAGAFNEFSVRPCVNFALSKNTTDVALAVDAMEIACTLNPEVIAIGSGDADFFPLVIKLRERGVRVVGFSLHGKMSAETAAGYGECFAVGTAVGIQFMSTELRQPNGSMPPASEATSSARKAAARKAPAKKAAAKKTKAVATKTAPAKKRAAAKKARPEPSLAQILAVLTELKTGKAIHLSGAAKLLHDANLLGKNGSSSKLFKRFPGNFELTPAAQPNHVRWVQTRQ